MRDSLTRTVRVRDGDDALITCVVRDVGPDTVMWKREDRERHSARVLTAGETRVTADRRFSVLHDSSTEDPSVFSSGGDVWVLVIKNVKYADSGIYICEVNSNPIVRSFHKLNVVSRAMETDNDTDLHIEDLKQNLTGRNHNYTDCCLTKSVSPGCLGFCNIQSILEGSTGQDPENCEPDFPHIVECMADGRDHVPCCIQERVPDICQDVCRGEYTAITDNIKTHFSCAAYTEQTLACITEGIELLPSPPENVEVEALTEKSLMVEWSLPLSNSETITSYSVNITALRIFDENESEEQWADNKSVTPAVKIIKVPTYQNSTVIENLTPFTMYEITVSALNLHGSSLPSYSVRAVTLTPGKVKQTKIAQAPDLPNIKSCCTNRNISHKTCINKLCDPTMTVTVEVTDLMICAPWAQDTFSCLTNGIDHTACCKLRGLPEVCQQLCDGNVTSIDSNHFKCLRYMGEYTNCLLQGYGVLPSAPTKVHLSNIETEFAVLHWSLPKTLGDTVMYYNVHIKKADSEEELYRTFSKVQSPYILEHLESDTDYEVFVEGVNTHGVGEPSSKLTFRTDSKIFEDELEEASNYNVTECCVKAQLSSACVPLCSYDANMSDIRSLATKCGADFPTILRCGAGGRNHNGCCTRRGVPPPCISLCSGVITDSLLITAATCVTYIGNIAMCFEEGTNLLPGPVSELHALILDESNVLVEWEPPEDNANVTDYVVHFQKVSNYSIHESLFKLDNQTNTTSTSLTLTNLEPNNTYQIFVVSRNSHGTSLPSSIIALRLENISDPEKTSIVHGVISPPHSLAVASHSATWVTVTWQAPQFSHPSEIITYRVFHKSTSEETFTVKNVSITSYMISNLNPNTQYIVYVQAVTAKGISIPSETLIAWTDPAYPAFVEPPTVHPINLVIEGSSMTILCIAMGTPMPTISLYISGRLVRQDTTRHMVTVIHNVTRDMEQISCYADNGYGTPMQASRKISISHGPHIQASGITMATIGESVVLECKVEALPEPRMIFWRNFEQRTPVIQGGKYDIVTYPIRGEEHKYKMQLTVKQISDADVGDYFCHAENAFGNATQPVSVRIRNLASIGNVTQCCIEENVTSSCMEACSFHLDIDAVIDKPECIQDFYKLMKCAADGSDHRNCCVHSEVPRRCLDWCRGEPVLNHQFCILSYTKPIMGCFHEMREKLPGPPQNVHVEFINANSASILWDPPIKNPHSVEMYKVMWRPLDSINKSHRSETTTETQLRITNLQDGVTYEAVIKAGNSKGTSTLTKAVRFTMGGKYVTSSASHMNDGSHVGVIVAVILALVVVAAIVAGAIWIVRTKKMLIIKTSSGIAFENPSYLREVNMDHIQVPHASAHENSTNTAMMNGISPSSGNGVVISTASGGPGWKNEALHVPIVQQEINPTLYEELKLGQDGAGFKRLKP